ncbi:hypothetical protein BD413DRAFT_178208 [Trametes elegans]|nr:hypothetical protein BD413DRAFT_178208 [Trametes elegans]
MSDKSPTNGSPGRAAEVLEVEDEEQRQERMHSLLARLNANATPGTSAPLPPFDFGDRTTLPPGPPLELLSRVQAFLPELAASNADLVRRARENPDSVDIENVGEDEENYIEMNLGLGVFDHRGELPPGIPVAGINPDVRVAESDSTSDSEDDSSKSSSNSSSSDSSSDDSSSDTDDDSAEDITPAKEKKNGRPTKPLPKRSRPGNVKKPGIVVLSETVDGSAPPEEQ